MALRNRSGSLWRRDVGQRAQRAPCVFLPRVLKSISFTLHNNFVISAHRASAPHFSHPALHATGTIPITKKCMFILTGVSSKKENLNGKYLKYDTLWLGSVACVVPTSNSRLSRAVDRTRQYAMEEDFRGSIFDSQNKCLRRLILVDTFDIAMRDSYAIVERRWLHCCSGDDHWKQALHTNVSCKRRSRRDRNTTFKFTGCNCPSTS